MKNILELKEEISNLNYGDFFIDRVELNELSYIMSEHEVVKGILDAKTNNNKGLFILTKEGFIFISIDEHGISSFKKIPLIEIDRVDLEIDIFSISLVNQKTISFALTNSTPMIEDFFSTGVESQNSRTQRQSRINSREQVKTSRYLFGFSKSMWVFLLIASFIFFLLYLFTLSINIEDDKEVQKQNTPVVEKTPVVKPVENEPLPLQSEEHLGQKLNEFKERYNTLSTRYGFEFQLKEIEVKNDEGYISFMGCPATQLCVTGELNEEDYIKRITFIYVGSSDVLENSKAIMSLHVLLQSANLSQQDGANIMDELKFLELLEKPEYRVITYKDTKYSISFSRNTGIIMDIFK